MDIRSCGGSFYSNNSPVTCETAHTSTSPLPNTRIGTLWNGTHLSFLLTDNLSHFHPHLHLHGCISRSDCHSLILILTFYKFSCHWSLVSPVVVELNIPWSIARQVHEGFCGFTTAVGPECDYTFCLPIVSNERKEASHWERSEPHAS